MRLLLGLISTVAFSVIAYVGLHALDLDAAVAVPLAVTLGLVSGRALGDRRAPRLHTRR